MCGILFTRSPTAQPPSQAHVDRISRRGPDLTSTHNVTTTTSTLTFTSSLLSLRGSIPTPQPVLDASTSSVLCWNGEAWRINGIPIAPGVNDTTQVFAQLLAADGAVENVLGKIEGEFAFVFYDAVRAKVWYGREWAGRRSLVRRMGADGGMQVASVGDEQGGWAEVDAGGVWCLDVESGEEVWIDAIRDGERAGQKIWDIPSMNLDIGNSELTGESPEVEDLRTVLTESIRLRVQAIPPPPAPLADPTISEDVRLAILFSGGVDCTVIARIAHDVLPPDEPIDLLNVAFENPRIIAARQKDALDAHQKHGTPELSALDPYSICPDRLTGLSSYAELLATCPTRRFRFISINIPYTEVLAHRSTVISLMSPQHTEMDLSIALAFYFASRGTGFLNSSPYTTPARILLSGLGADELFGGYTRHATAFSRGGYTSLLDELNLDFKRLGKRNLGRDDRVVSTWAREIRYPFLDEHVVTWAMRAHVTAKCPFGQSAGEVDRPKMVLRLLARRLGVVKAAAEAKRAVQFGARSAKMVKEERKLKGGDGVRK